MWKPWAWTTASHERAIANARTATTECSRRRLEREEVALYLATRAEAVGRAPGDGRHLVVATDEHLA